MFSMFLNPIFVIEIFVQQFCNVKCVFGKWVEFARGGVSWGGSVTNGATPSCFNRPGGVGTVLQTAL